VQSYLQGAFAVPMVASGHVRNVLTKGELTDIFTLTGSYKSQKSHISENLYVMRSLLERIKQMDTSIHFILQNLKGKSTSSRQLYSSRMSYALPKSHAPRTPSPHAPRTPSPKPVQVRTIKSASGKAPKTKRTIKNIGRRSTQVRYTDHLHTIVEENRL
jgi:hypothetical protein